MLKAGLYIIFIIGMFVFSSCKCPTEIDTPRIIEPDNSALLRLVNCHSDESISLYSDDISVLENLQSGDVSEDKAVLADNSIISIRDAEDNIILNMPVNLIKDSSYTAIFMNTGDFSNLEILADGGSMQGVEMLRFINTTTDVFKIHIGENEMEQELTFSESTGFIPAVAGEILVKIYKNGNIAFEKNITINQFTKHTFVINKLSGSINFIELKH